MEIWVVDPAGFQVEQIQQQYPEKGQDLYTSLDIDLQLAGEEAFGDRRGALVALDLDTMEVLSLISKPDYNLNDTSPSISRKTFNEINENEAWLNRATQGLYPPGSPFKLISSIAGLKAGTITPETECVCEGYLKG